MSEKQFKIEFDGHRYFLVIDEVNERCLARLDTMQDARAWLEVYEMLSDECEQLKEENEDLNDELMEYDSFVLLYKEQRDELKKENENLKIVIDAKETLIDVCEKKFEELGYIISCDDDGYIVEDLE